MDKEQKEYELGQIVGLEHAAAIINEKASDSFKLKHHDKAIELQNLAEEIIQVSVVERRRYDEKYHSE